MNMTTSRHLLGIGILALVIIAGCGDDAGSPTAPTAPQFPQVAGTYTGPITLTWSLVPQPAIGSAQMTVVQAGSQLTITGSITFSVETRQIPAVTGAINETGFFTATTAGGFYNNSVLGEDCGTVTGTSSTLTFLGSTAMFHEGTNTDFCGSLTLVGTLTR